MKRSHPPLVWFVLAVFILALGLVFIRRSPKHVREPGGKPYDVAVYDVYSEFLHAETTERPWLERLLDPRPDGVLIRIDTTVEGSGHRGALDNQAACIGDLKRQGLDGEEASSACVDYVRRIKQPFQLQKKPFQARTGHQKRGTCPARR
jgi:hypothetical protein